MPPEFPGIAHDWRQENAYGEVLVLRFRRQPGPESATGTDGESSFTNDGRRVPRVGTLLSHPSVSIQTDWLPYGQTSSDSDRAVVREWGVGYADQQMYGGEIPDATGDSRYQNLPACPVPWRHPLKFLAWLGHLVFGLVSLFLLLAAVAAVPVVNFVAFGYLLEAQARVIRTGKLSAGLPLLGLAPRLGSIALGVWLWLLPVRVFSDVAADARLLGPHGAAAGGWTLLSYAVNVLVTVHLCLALAYGGNLGSFVRPIRNARWLVRQLRQGTYFEEAESAIVDFWRALRVGHHFWLGLRGLVGAGLWLAIPCSLLAIVFSVENPITRPGQIVAAVVGGVMLIVVLTWVPFLQARMAAENRFRAMFELSAIRELYRRSPLFFSLVVILTYGLSIPLYIFKAFSTPQDALWMVTPIYIASIYPARVLTGWAYARAASRQGRAFLMWRWVWFISLPLLLGIYVLILILTPAIGVEGPRVLFEHPALMLPVPF